MPKDRGDEKEGMQGRVKIKPELLDEALKGYRGPQDLEEIFKEFKKAVLERALGAELSQHLGYGKGEDKPEHQSNHRNGASGKRILTDQGSLEIEVPRDRESSFEPRLIKKGERRFSGFDDKIIAMYARGMTVREIQGYLQEMYGVLVSPDLISQVTDAVMEQVREWQNRPLERLYPVVFFDALRIKIRDEGTVKNKAVYLALGVLPDGTKDILGIWIEQSEGAKFWLRVMRRHGGESPGSLRGLFPWDLGQEIPTHRADLEAAMGAGHSVFLLPRRGEKNYLHDQRHREPAHAAQKIIKNRGHFPNDDAAGKLLYLALRNITKDWKMSAREWKSAMNQFAIVFADRFMPRLH